MPLRHAAPEGRANQADPTPRPWCKSARSWAPELAAALHLHAGMILFRSLALGLLGACFWLLATRPSVIVEAPPQVQTNEEATTILDVSPAVTREQLPSLVHLRDGEHVVAIDNAAVASDLDAGRMLASIDRNARKFVELGVAGPRGQRRILMLLH